jgi:hypothetical protein
VLLVITYGKVWRCQGVPWAANRRWEA